MMFLLSLFVCLFCIIVPACSQSVMYPHRRLTWSGRRRKISVRGGSCVTQTAQL